MILSITSELRRALLKQANLWKEATYDGNRTLVRTGTSLGASSSTLTDLDDGMERRGDLSWGDRIFQILNLTEKSNGRDNLLIIDHSRGQYSNLYYRGRLN